MLYLSVKIKHKTNCAQIAKPFSQPFRVRVDGKRGY
jgi:hypothetical protein